MSITLDTITHAVNTFNDIPDINFDSIDIGEFANDVEIYTNTPAVMIPTKLNAMASSMKTWLNSNIATPLEAQQNTFKNEVVVRTNEAMDAVETYINNEVKAFVNDIFIPWANNSGVILSDNANLLETNISQTLSQLMTDYSTHVSSQDAVIAQALIDLELNLAQYTTGATDSGYSVHQTNQLIADLIMTSAINQDNYTFDNTGINVTSAREGDFTTHHIVYDVTDNIVSFGESLEISGEVRPFVNHNVLDLDTTTRAISIEQVKAYDFTINTSADGTKTFRVTGHEADGTAATDLTILNNTSIPDVDNPELIISRGRQYALIFNDINNGDYVVIKDMAGNDYNTGVGKRGVGGQYAEDGDTILFRPNASYCHDSNSDVLGHGVTADMGASFVENSFDVNSDPQFDSPLKCEQYFASEVTILDDFTRSYELDIPNESYSSSLFDGMIYKVYISDDSGFIDSYSYTIDHNGKLGTGAICNASYDDGCSDVTITNSGTGYSDASYLRVLDVDGVLTQATATVTIGNGTIVALDTVNAGADYTGYWELQVPNNGGLADHVHTVQLSQADIDSIKGGMSITATTVELGHNHDVTVIWNEFSQNFMYEEIGTTGIYSTGDHDHGRYVGDVNVNPEIVVTISGDGSGASAYVTLEESNGSISSIVMVDGGIGYNALVNVIITGGGPSTAATTTYTTADGAVQSINVTNQGAGYVDTSAATIDISLQNGQFVPANVSAKVGDTLRFTNNDLAGHDVEHVDGMFKSPNIPQNGVWEYIIDLETEITDKYMLTGSGISTGCNVWVRESTVYVDIVALGGGGCRAKGTVDGSGSLIDVAVISKGQGYAITDSVRILDCSGPGEGAYGAPVIMRDIETVTVTAGGTGYDASTQVKLVDPMGMILAGGDTPTFGSGATVKVIIDDGENITDGIITAIEVVNKGENYADVQFIIIGTGTGAVLTADTHMHVSDFAMDTRGVGYLAPTPIVIDPIGNWGPLTNVVGQGFVGTASLNDGIGAIVIIDDWKDYVEDEARLTVVDIHPEPTGYGAAGTVELNAQGAVTKVIITDSGSAYKQPQVTIDGPVVYIGSSINNVNTDLALYGPEGNTDASPYSANGTALSNYKNGVMIQFENPNGHTLNDSWEFKLQTWIAGTPESLIYRTYHWDGIQLDTSGIITLNDIWEEVTV